MTKTALNACSLVAVLSCAIHVRSNPQSKPYIALRTNPYDDASRLLDFAVHEDKVSEIHRFDRLPSTQCPLQFSLGISKRWHKLEKTPAFAINQAPILHTVFPAAGPGKQVLYTTQYEHLDLLSPAPVTTDTFSTSSVMREALIQNPEFPWLWESSAFHASPIVHDVNADGIPDVILADYDGGIYIRGLANGANDKRYSHHAQTPRLYVRRNWVEGRVKEALGNPSNETEDNNNIDDPYHTYFEYYYSEEHKEDLLRGITANHLGHDSEQAKAYKSRRHRNREGLAVSGSSDSGSDTSNSQTSKSKPDHDHHHHHHHRHHHDSHWHNVGDIELPVEGDEIHRRRLEEAPPPNVQAEEALQREIENEEAAQAEADRILQYDDLVGATIDDLMRADDGAMPIMDDFEKADRGALIDDDDDDHYGRMKIDDLYGHHHGYDDVYGGAHYHDKQNDYYDEAHYIRVPPHILSTPVLAELPRAYGDSNERDDVLIVAMSYYFDEDEYEGRSSYKRFKATDIGDETEVKRGQYVASAIMSYNLGDFGRWGAQTHLDLSTDHSAPENATMVGMLPIKEDVTHMGAFALTTPTVADIDGDGMYEVLIGTSMGNLYAVDARHLFLKNFWPVQMPYAVESKILVEDVIGDTKLELFVADVGGNIACLSHDGKVLWSRNVLRSLGRDGGIRQMSPLMLGDVDGDGSLDVVATVQVKDRAYVFSMNAVTGRDIANFPMEIQLAKDVGEAHKIPAPLLVDLHSDQDFLLSYIRRNGTAYQRPTRRSKSSDIPHGGSASGLHIVQPLGPDLYIIEGGSGCTQAISIGDKISSMVQVDDVHGTGRLDLVIATESGNTITLESAAPYHPLNTWSKGESRGRGMRVHGYSGSQGIYVHEVSRQYVDIFGVFVPITFEIFDNRPGIASEPEKKKYIVEIRDGTSSKRTLLRGEYTSTGVYTERVYIRYGPGYYTLSVVMTTSHGLMYEDSFAIGYNVHFLNGFGVILWLPLLFASMTIFLFGAKRSNWNDEEYEDDARENASLGILGRSLPT